ncbi:MAG: TIGR04283 family arsenosugar biosynthesis glycosyltransferase, partial [Syntrophaceae bacterium]|nr:TIGR04283 family arsenosugar biosynthesis glycosyltransferase [Syntrophaceae bacterium]
SMGVRVIHSPRGRGRQMNLGAREASGDVLLFLHADTRLPEGFAPCIRGILSRPGISAGAFLFHLDARSPGLSLIQKIANWRSRVFQFPYGDQGIFLKKGLFEELGGYPEMPIMEDYELIRRLKKRGRIYTAPLPALTSARRWEELGVWRTTILNQIIVLAYYLGISPRTLARWYRRS